MNILNRIGCLFGKHERSGKKALLEPDGTARSVCKGCGKPMIKDGVSWRMDE